MPRTPRPSTAPVTVGLLLLCALLYLPPAIATPFFTKGEPREALVVRRMVEDGNWVLPIRDAEHGLVVASKPPFFHWLGALASLAAGATTELTVRTPSIVLGTGAVLLVWLVGRTLLTPAAACAGAVVLATTVEWVRTVSSARVDGTLVALLTAALLFFYRGFVRGGLSRAEAVTAYGCLVGATLTKGPVGFVLPAIVLGTALIWHGKLGLVPRFRPVLGIVMVLSFTGAWYLGAWYLGGDAFFERQVLKENVFRFLGASRLKSGHEHPVYYYLPALAAGFLPWTPFLVAALMRALRSREARRDPRTAFLLVWFAVVFVFYSAASAKRSVYLLALYPAAGLLVGWWWEELRLTTVAPRWLRGWGPRSVLGVVIAALSLLGVLALAERLGFAPLALVAPLFHAKDQANLPIVRSTIDIHFVAVLVALGIMLAVLVAAMGALQRERWWALFAANACLATTLWVLVFGIFQPALARQRTLKPFFADVGMRTAGRQLAFYAGTFDWAAAFYGPHGMSRWPRDREHGPGPHYVLVWHDDLVRVAAEHTAGFDVLATSDGTNPKGRRHLSLVALY